MLTRRQVLLSVLAPLFLKQPELRAKFERINIVDTDVDVEAAFWAAAPKMRRVYEAGFKYDCDGTSTLFVEGKVQVAQLSKEQVSGLDQCKFEITALPLPVTHTDVTGNYSEAILASARRCGEAVERLYRSTLDAAAGSKTYTLQEACSILERRGYADDGLYNPVAGFLLYWHPSVVRVVIGFQPCLVELDGQYKVMAIVVPQIRANIVGEFGVVRVA